MDSSVYPNLNADVYRNMTAADRPPVINKNLQFILIYNENSAVLGGSNMTDRYWCGTVWYFKSITDFNKDKAFAASDTGSGACDGVFISENKFVICEDSGVLQVFSLDNTDSESDTLQCLGYACQHDDSILTVSAFSDASRVVTGGMDYCIKVWDLEELITQKSFGFAHTDIITSVDVQPRSDTTFVSTSLDCEALIWDIRQSKPAQRILKEADGLTAVNWNCILDHIVAVGDAIGNVKLIDIRKTGTPVLHEASVSSRGIHKLLFNPNAERSEQLACCSDDTLVEVVDINSEFFTTYKNEDHTDFVRGLAWCGDMLYTCSWDNTVIKHKIDY